MTETTRPQQIFTGIAVALVLFVATLDAYIAAGTAIALLIAGLAVFPAMRRHAIRAAVIALALAAVLALARAV